VARVALPASRGWAWTKAAPGKAWDAIKRRLPF
jgi:hypothetical protein